MRGESSDTVLDSTNLRSTLDDWAFSPATTIYEARAAAASFDAFSSSGESPSAASIGETGVEACGGGGGGLRWRVQSAEGWSRAARMAASAVVAVVEERVAAERRVENGGRVAVEGGCRMWFGDGGGDGGRNGEGLDAKDLGRLGGNVKDLGEIAGTLEELVITELALSAMDELIQLAQLKERLWVSSMDHNTVVLDKQEYVRFFSRATIAATNLKGYKIEAGMLQEVTSVVY
nr:homeobox-leucine zipper protein HDG2-like isoform X1 [Ipomoea batatas]